MQHGKQSLRTGNLLGEECPKLLFFFLNKRLDNGGSDVLRQRVAISQKWAANKR